MPYKESKKREVILISIMVTLALLFRLFLMRYRYAIVFDEVNYLKLAASGSLEGISNILHTYWSPFYPLVVALFSKIVTNFELAGRLVSIVSGSLIILPVYFFVQKNVSRRTAILTAIFLAFLPSFAFLSTRAQTEALYTLIAVTAVLWGWQILLNPSVKKAIVLGPLFGCAYLTKPEGIGFLLVFMGNLLVVVFYQIVKKQHPWKLIISGILIIGFFLLFASPYLLFLHKATGKWTISAKGKANQQFEAVTSGVAGKSFRTFRSLSDDNKHVLIDQIYHIGTFLKAENKKAQPTVSVNYQGLMRKYVENFYKVTAFGMNHALTSTILILMVFGLFGSPWDKKRFYRDLYLLAYVTFFWFIVIPLFHINDRYFLSVLPICLIWASQGVFFFISWFEKTILFVSDSQTTKIRPRLLASIAVALILLIGLFLPQFGKILNRNPWIPDYYMDPIELKVAGNWIKAHSEKTPIIMSLGHTTDFYAGNYHIAESVTIPENDLVRILEYAKFRKVDFLVLNERYSRGFQRIAYLLDTKKIPDGLSLAYAKDFRPGLKTVVYKIDRNDSN